MRHVTWLAKHVTMVIKVLVLINVIFVDWFFIFVLCHPFQENVHPLQLGNVPTEVNYVYCELG